MPTSIFPGLHASPSWVPRRRHRTVHRRRNVPAKLSHSFQNDASSPFYFYFYFLNPPSQTLRVYRSYRLVSSCYCSSVKSPISSSVTVCRRWVLQLLLVLHSSGFSVALDSLSHLFWVRNCFSAAFEAFFFLDIWVHLDRRSSSDSLLLF